MGPSPSCQRMLTHSSRVVREEPLNILPRQVEHIVTEAEVITAYQWVDVALGSGTTSIFI